MNKNLMKTLTFLSETGFVRTQNDKVKSFASLGLFVRENVKNQLKKFYKQNDKFSYFLSNELNDVKGFVTTFSKLDSIVNSFALVYKQDSLVNQSDLILKTDQNNQINYTNQLSSFNQCLALFCNRELSLNYFHWLQSKRHRFWRKLAANPSNFQMTSVCIDENNLQNLNIIYKDQNVNLGLEKISYYKTLEHLNLKDNEMNNLKDYLNNLDLIVCETNVDLSTLSLLCDSYNEKETKQFMSLNEYLTPYQYAITVINPDRKLGTNSKELIGYIFDQAKNIDLNIYPFVSFNDKDNLLFDNYDKIGVLYTILIEDDELDKGFLSLRNRDTNMIEKFHVTQLKSYLSLYAKLN